MKIIKCSCEHQFQDSKYGNSMRVHNAKQKADLYICTVCGTQRYQKDSKDAK